MPREFLPPKRRREPKGRAMKVPAMDRMVREAVTKGAPESARGLAQSKMAQAKTDPWEHYHRD